MQKKKKPNKKRTNLLVSQTCLLLLLPFFDLTKENTQALYATTLIRRESKNQHGFSIWRTEYQAHAHTNRIIRVLRLPPSYTSPRKEKNEKDQKKKKKEIDDSELSGKKTHRILQKYFSVTVNLHINH